MRVLREGPVKITKTTVEAAWKRRAKDQRLVIGDAECRGLALVVNPTGMTWRFDYKPRGTDPRTGKRFASQSVVIGNPESHSVERARTEAGALKGRTQAGADPGAEKRLALIAEREARAKAEADAVTVKALIELYAEKHVATLRPATQRDVLSRLKLHLQPIAQKPAGGIGRRDAARVVDKAAEAGETTARRVRDYARAMWAWAQRRGTLPEGTPNPWEHAPAPGKDVPRDRVLSAEQVGEVWRAAGTLAAPYGPLVRLTLLTLARREEVTAMTWGEVAPDLSTWTQPGTRTKNGKAHVVHMAEPAREILRALLGAEEGKPLPALPKADRLVFGLAGNKPVTTHSWVKREIDSAIAEARAKDSAEAGEPAPEPMPAWVLHDFRRSGVTWLAGAGFPPHVADRLLNHVQGTIRGVAAIYQRGEFLEERRAALEAWGAHVAACGEGRGLAPNVTVLAERRRA
jgi:integrase